MNKEERIKELVDILNEASRRYYNGMEEMMSNFEWDALFDELSVLENETGIVLPDSPTKRAGYEEEEKGEKEEHEFPALSLAKTKDIEELKAFAGERDIYLSYKLDGLTLVVTYDGGKLTKILTRGNGHIGTNITKLKTAINGIPSEIKEKGHVVVRGEALISYTDFEIINDTIESEDERYANPRNLASGTLSLDDPEEVKKRNVRFVAFTLVHLDRELVSFGDRMKLLKDNGFEVVEHKATNRDSLKAVVDEFTEKVEQGKMDYPVDGLVITYDDTDYAKTGSVTGHHATRAGLAFKWQDTVAKSKLLFVEWSCAISTISPVAVFEPVELEGTTVQRASLCNISEMERLGIGGEGSTLDIIKSNKIIPKVVAVEEKCGELIIPDKCPVCGSPTKIEISKKSGTKTLRCTNQKCPAKSIKRFNRFVSKQGMDIDGMSIQTIVRFVNEGFIHNAADFFKLDRFYEKIEGLEGFGEKSVANLDAAIKKSRKVNPVNLIFSLCIPKIGYDAAKQIINAMGFSAFKDAAISKSDFEGIKLIGNERTKCIHDYFDDQDNLKEFNDLLEVVDIVEEERIEVEKTLSGMVFVVTGDVFNYKNRNELKDYIESRGGTVTGSVSSKTNYLINNDVESTSSKNKKAKEIGIPIISEDEFIRRFDPTRSL